MLLVRQMLGFLGLWAIYVDFGYLEVIFQGERENSSKVGATPAWERDLSSTQGNANMERQLFYIGGSTNEKK